MELAGKVYEQAAKEHQAEEQANQTEDEGKEKVEDATYEEK